MFFLQRDIKVDKWIYVYIDLLHKEKMGFTQTTSPSNAPYHDYVRLCKGQKRQTGLVPRR